MLFLEGFFFFYICMQQDGYVFILDAVFASRIELTPKSDLLNGTVI